MRVYLLRHAEAAPGIPDAARALTDRGRAQVDAVASALNWSFLKELKHIEHSGLVRARQTAERLVGTLGAEVPLQVRPGIRPNDDPFMIALDLATSKEDRMLVGHNPHLSRLGGLLLGGGTEVPLVLKKAGLVVLERSRPVSKEHPLAHWTLLWAISASRLANAPR